MDTIRGSAKAIVGVIAAAASAYLTGPVLDWTQWVSVTVTAVITGIAVWITRNTPAP